MTRLSSRTARRTSQGLLLVGTVAVVAAFFLVVARPGFVGGLAAPVPVPDEIPLAAAVFGLVWLFRIYRQDAEAGRSPWRYHEWD